MLHAVWNLLLARARDVEAAAATTFVLSVVIAAPFAVVWWHADASVWPYALASSLLEIVYVVALAVAYRVGEMSFVYPITRGLAPVLALVFAVVALDHHASVAEVAGVLLVAVGVILVRGPGGRSDARALLLVAVIATSIAGYTLVDRAGIQHAGALPYFVLTLLGPCLVYPPLVGARRMIRELHPETIVAGLANLGSYSLALLALRYGPAAPVLAVRSSSVVLATALAAPLLAERISRARLTGSVVVFAGIVLLGLG